MHGFMRAQLHLIFFFSVLMDGVAQEAIFPCLCWTKLIKYCWTNLHNSDQLERVQSQQETDYSSWNNANPCLGTNQKATAFLNN